MHLEIPDVNAGSPSIPPPARRSHELRVRPTEARIDTGALGHNLREVRRCAPTARVMAVVKADGYGHGGILSARAFEEAGADWLGVALVEEGVELRRAGLVRPILVLGAQYTDYGLLLKYRLTPLVYRADQLDALEAAGRMAGMVLDAHVKLDTGMGRIGVQPADFGAFLTHAKSLAHVRLTGLATHFANADLRDPAHTARAVELFQTGRRAMVEQGFPLELAHLANSAAVMDLPATHFDMVRPGLMLYGAAPAPRFSGLANLKPALSWVTAFSHVKKVAAGTPISYGHKWVARRESLIGTLPVGYADGVRRSLTNVGVVLAGGKRCGIAGTVCMDMMMVDITDVPEAKIGDEVVLIGAQGHEQIDAHEVADRCGTIPYEIFCNISARVPRVAV
ncbi:MAG: alanine racemase [Deltaproteobacteria bacterium]|nr:alanine racemase [Deltaproteobacteria bacterium]